MVLRRLFLKFEQVFGHREVCAIQFERNNLLWGAKKGKILPKTFNFRTMIFKNYLATKYSSLMSTDWWNGRYFQSVFTCSKLTKETLEQGVKYVQS